jgi:hypothetical protein
MTHEEFCRKGGAAKTEVKMAAARRNLKKAQAARKVQNCKKTTKPVRSAA